MRFSPRDIISYILKKSPLENSSYDTKIAASIFLSAISPIGFYRIISSEHGSVIFSGLTSTLEETSEIIKGIGKFFDSVKALFSFIAGFIDPGALILLIIVAILSTGLSFLGIRKGGFSFFFSLIIADIFWFTWIKSFNQSYDLTNKIFIMARSNLLLILPFLVIHFFKTQTFSKKLKPKIIAFFRSVFKRKKPHSYKENEIIFLTEELNISNALLQKNITRDILNRKKKEDIILSAETLKQLKTIKEILEKINNK